MRFLFVLRGFVVTLHFWVENSQRTVPASFCDVIRVHCLGNAHLPVLSCPPPIDGVVDPSAAAKRVSKLSLKSPRAYKRGLRKIDLCTPEAAAAQKSAVAQ